TFNYYLDNEKIIKTGDFSFIANWSDNSCPTHLIKEFWNGTYSENVKVKEWTYSIQEYNVVIFNINPKEMNYEIRLVQSDYKTNYLNGGLEDNFLYERTLYINDNREKTLEKLEITFSDHKVNGEINYDYNKEN